MLACESCLATNECAVPGSRRHRWRLKVLTGMSYDCGDAQFRQLPKRRAGKEIER